MSVHAITPRVFIRYFLAILQIYCGYRAMDLCWDVLVDPSISSWVIAGVALLPTIAGLGLILHLPTGRILTLLAQGVQIIGFSSPAFTWLMCLGFSSRIQVNGIPSDVPGETYLGAAGHIVLGNEASLAIGHPHPDFEGYTLSLNLLALVIMITAWFMFRKKKGESEGVPG